MSPGALPLTEALSPLAAEQGVDLTRFASAEIAFEQMCKAVLAHDDETFFAAKARFDSLTKGSVE